MTSETDIINDALIEVGEATIISRTDGSKAANTADVVYDQTRDTLLRNHNWNFAASRAKLAKLSAAPEFEYDNAFAFPSDWLRTITVHNNDAGHGTFDYMAEFQDSQRVIATSSDDVWMRYVFRQLDPNFMQADFVEALIFELARKFAIPLAGSGTLHDRLEKKARRWLAAARSSDALGSTPERRPLGSWRSSRGGNRGGGDYHHQH